MEDRRFGRMARVDLPVPVDSRCEVIQFDRAGTPHQHGVDEVAVCVSGSGVVDVAGVPHLVQAGQFVWVPAGVDHYMIPDDGVVLSMLVAYARTT